MGDVPDIDPLFLIESFELEHPLLYCDSLLEGGVVHALGASEGPAVLGFRFAMMVMVLGTCCVYYRSV